MIKYRLEGLPDNYIILKSSDANETGKLLVEGEEKDMIVKALSESMGLFALPLMTEPAPHDLAHAMETGPLSIYLPVLIEGSAVLEQKLAPLPKGRYR